MHLRPRAQCHARIYPGLSIELPSLPFPLALCQTNGSIAYLRILLLSRPQASLSTSTLLTAGWNKLGRYDGLRAMPHASIRNPCQTLGFSRTPAARDRLDVSNTNSIEYDTVQHRIIVLAAGEEGDACQRTHFRVDRERPSCPFPERQFPLPFGASLASMTGAHSACSLL
jgi:hypothetical protein